MWKDGDSDDEMCRETIDGFFDDHVRISVEELCKFKNVLYLKKEFVLRLADQIKRLRLKAERRNYYEGEDQ